MQTPQAQPLYEDFPKSRFNITLILALAVVVIGLGGDIRLAFLGIVGAAFSWLTTPRQFLIYQNALVVVYGRPRVKAIPFPDIADVDILSMPMGNRLRVRMVNGKRLVVSMRDIEQFRDRLNEALGNFGGNPGGSNIIDQPPEDRTPY